MIWASKLTSARPTSDDAGELAAEAFIESYVCWREACEDVRAAYGHWGSCKPPQRGLAFDSYLAALDREEEAARIHSDRAQWVRAVKR